MEVQISFFLLLTPRLVRPWRNWLLAGLLEKCSSPACVSPWVPHDGHYTMQNGSFMHRTLGFSCRSILWFRAPNSNKQLSLLYAPPPLLLLPHIINSSIKWTVDLIGVLNSNFDQYLNSTHESFWNMMRFSSELVKFALPESNYRWRFHDWFDSGTFSNFPAEQSSRRRCTSIGSSCISYPILAPLSRIFRRVYGAMIPAE